MMSAFQKSLLTSRLPPQGTKRPHRSQNPRGKLDFSPVKWDKYFEEKKDIQVNGNSFRVYTIGQSGPAIVLLHGGGYSALTWSILSSFLYEMIECQILSIDLRGHGDTTTTDDDNLEISVLSSDVVSVINEVFPEGTPVVLVGHSMGGSVAVHAAHNEKLTSLVGLVVIDVVEGTALGALSSMQSILRGRPQSFNSIEEAIKWSVQSGQLKNLESAKISMPGQIKNVASSKSATAELDNYTPSEEATSTRRLTNVRHASVESISEGEEAVFKKPSGKYTWRIDLKRTEKHWTGWFEGLSKLFLSCHAQKLLLLASLDRLDTDLTVAQMQGKFEVHAFEQSRGRCGHAVHEDIPDAVSEVIATYMIRNKFAFPKTDIPKSDNYLSFA